MQRLTAEKILAVWEAGRPQHALDRALTILAAASPGASREALADLTIGERDARLLQLRALVLGPRAEGFARMPAMRRAGRVSARHRRPCSCPGMTRFRASASCADPSRNRNERHHNPLPPSD